MQPPAGPLVRLCRQEDVAKRPWRQRQVHPSCRPALAACSRTCAQQSSTVYTVTVYLGHRHALVRSSARGAGTPTGTPVYRSCSYNRVKRRSHTVEERISSCTYGRYRHAVRFTPTIPAHESSVAPMK